MIPIFIAAIVSIILFIAVFAIGSRIGAGEAEIRQKSALDRIYTQTGNNETSQKPQLLLKRDITADISSPLLRKIISFPAIRNMYELMLKAGYYGRIDKLMLIFVIIFFVITFSITRTKFASIAPFISIALTWYLLRKHLKNKIHKRNLAFINIFPDAIDIVVRSVRAGHPINTALRMIAESSDPPVSTEFKQVVDEVSYGRTLIEALSRMSLRIDDQDLQFFIVVLSIQQETGSSLSEVLTNLSSVIRKRKQLRLKVKSMTSEGRATALILGALPLVVLLALWVFSPDYLAPMFNTTIGLCMFGGAMSLIFMAFFVVNQMIKIDI